MPPPPGAAIIGVFPIRSPTRRRLGLNITSGIPNFVQIAISNYFSVGCGTCAPGHFNVNSFHYADDVDIIKGRHQMAFGVNFIRDQMNVINGFQQNGSYTANGQFTNGRPGGLPAGQCERFPAEQSAAKRHARLGVRRLRARQHPAFSAPYHQRGDPLGAIVPGVRLFCQWRFVLGSGL